MSTITVTGHSDDTISISGDLSDEFNHYDNGPAYLTFDDGTVLSAHYTNGIWGFMPERSGSSTVHVDLPVKPDGYTETATITGPITRVRYTTDRAEAMPRTPFEDLDSLLNVLDDERLEAGDDVVADRLPGAKTAARILSQHVAVIEAILNGYPALPEDAVNSADPEAALVARMRLALADVRAGS